MARCKRRLTMFGGSLRRAPVRFVWVLYLFALPSLKRVNVGPSTRWRPSTEALSTARRGREIATCDPLSTRTSRM